MSICITTNYILAHNYCLDVYMHYHKLYSCPRVFCGCLYTLPQTIFLLTIIAWMSIYITTNYILAHNYCLDVYMHYHKLYSCPQVLCGCLYTLPHTIFLLTIIVWMSICITTNYILAHNYCVDVYMHYHKLYSCSQLLCGCLYALPQTIFLLAIIAWIVYISLPQTIFLLTIIVWMSIYITTNYILAHNYCLDVYMHYHKLYSCPQVLCGCLYTLPQTIFLLTIIVWMSICITTNYILAHNYCLDVYMHYHKLYSCPQVFCGCLYTLPQTIFLLTIIAWMSIYITTNYILAHNYCLDVYMHYHKLYSCPQVLCGCLYTLPHTIFLLTIIVWMSICITTNYILAHNYCVDVYMHYHKLYSCSQLLLGCLYALPQTIFLPTSILWMSICITTNYILAHKYSVDVYIHYHKLYSCSQLLLGCLYALKHTIFLLTIIVWMSICITTYNILAHNYCVDVYMHYHKLYSCSQLLGGCLYALPQTIFLLTIIAWMSICITTNYILAHNYCVDVYMHYHKLYSCSQLLLGCLYALPQTIFLLTIIVWMSICITTSYILAHNYCVDVYMHYHKLYSCSQLLCGCLYALPQTIFLPTSILWMSIYITTNYILARNYCLDVYMHYHKLYSCSQLLCGCLYTLPQTIFLLTIIAWMSIGIITNYILAHKYCVDVYIHYHIQYSCSQLLCGCLYALPQTIFLLTIIVWMSICITTYNILAQNYSLDVYIHYHKRYSCSQLLCGCLYALPQTIFLLTIIAWMSICITKLYSCPQVFCGCLYTLPQTIYSCPQVFCGCLYTLPQTIFLLAIIAWMSICITTNYILAHNYCVDVYIHYHKLYSCSQLLLGCLYALSQTIFLPTSIVWMSIYITTYNILAHNYCVDVYMHYHIQYSCSQLFLGCLYALPQTIFLLTIIVWMSICITINYILAHNYCVDVYMHYHKLYSCSQLLLGCLYALPQTIFLLTIIVWMSICITTNYILAHNYCLDVYMHYHKLYSCSQLLCGCLYALPQAIFLLTIIVWMSICITTNYILAHNYCLDVYMHYHKQYSCSQLLLGCLYALPQTIFLLTIIAWMSICITTNYILAHKYSVDVITTNYILAHNYCVDVYMHYHKLYSCSQLLLGCLYALPQTIFLITIIGWMSICITTNYILAHKYSVDVYIHYHKLYSCSQLLCGCLYALPQTIFLLAIIAWMSICITTNYILAHNYCLDVYMHYHKLYSCPQVLCGCLYTLPHTIFLLTIIVWMSICITTYNILAHNYSLDVYMHYHKQYSCSQLLLGCLYALPQTIFLLTIIAWMSIYITTNFILDHNYCVDVYMHYHKLYSCSQVLLGCLYALPQTIFLPTSILWMSIYITTNYILAHNYCVDVYIHYHKLYSCSQLLCGCLYTLPQTIFLLTIIVWMSICIITSYILAHNYCVDVYMHYHKLYSCSQLLLGCLYALPQTIFLLTIIVWMSICITTNYILAHNYCVDVYIHYHKLYSCSQLLCGCLYALPQTIFLLTIIVWVSIYITTNYILDHNYCVDVYMHYHKL